MKQDHLIAFVAISCAVVSAVVSALLVVGVSLACVFGSSSELPVAESLPDAAGESGSSPGVLAELIMGTEAARERLKAEEADAHEAFGQAAELVSDGGIAIDGSPLALDDAEAIVSSGGSFTGGVGFVDQRDILPAGCEIVALAVALRAEGFDASPVEIAEAHLDMSGSGERSYGGSPWVDGGGVPASIVDAGNSWLAEHAPGGGARAMDLTGTSFSGVLRLVALGYPVLVWTTEDMVDPVLSGAFQSGVEWYFPEHCVVVYGLEGDDVLVSDSLAGLVRRNRADFERIYGSCGNLAAFVLP